MRRRATFAAAVLGLLATGPAAAHGAAKTVWDGPRLCTPTMVEATWTVLLCGRADQLREPRLTLTGVDGARTWEGTSHEEVPVEIYDGPGPIPHVRVATAGGSEPLLPGERLTARWAALRGSAVLRVEVADPIRRSRVITVPLRAGEERTSLSVAADGVVTVRAGGRTRVHPVPPRGLGEPGGPTVRWTARTPRAAVADVLPHLRSYDAGAGATLCAAIESAVRTSYAAWTDVLDGPRAASYVCASEIAWGQELLGTRGTIGAVRRIGATQATVDVRLRQWLDSYSGPELLTGRSRVLVVRERDGRWRIATPDALFGSSRQPPSLSYLRKRRAALRKDAAARHAYGVRWHRAVARTVVRIGAGDVTCDGPLRSVDDPVDDATVGDFVTRDPRSHRADLIRVEQGTVAGRLCFALTYAAPQADPLGVELDLRQGAASSLVDVHTGRGRALVSKRSGAFPLAGATIDRRGPRLRIVLPAGLGPAPAALTDWTVGTTAVHPYDYQFADRAGTVVRPPLGTRPDDPTSEDDDIPMVVPGR